MKFLIFLLLPLTLFAHPQIEVIEKSTGKVVAGDYGPNVTVQTLRQKMLSSGIDINSPNYSISVKNVPENEYGKKPEEIARDQEIKRIKGYLTDIDASQKPEWEKELLKRLIKELKE